MICTSRDIFPTLNTSHISPRWEGDGLFTFQLQTVLLLAHNSLAICTSFDVTNGSESVAAVLYEKS